MTTKFKVGQHVYFTVSLEPQDDIDSGVIQDVRYYGPGNILYTILSDTGKAVERIWEVTTFEDLRSLYTCRIARLKKIIGRLQDTLKSCEEKLKQEEMRSSEQEA